MNTLAHDALKRLKDGNLRFVAGTTQRDPLANSSLRTQLVNGQEPFAIILGCSDSRVPPEVIFDQSLGDLFVIRVAGNIVAPFLVGSIEYAAAQLGTRLIVVLGHSQCGAVGVSLQELERPSLNLSPNVKTIVDFVQSSVASLPDTNASRDPERFAELIIRANVRYAARRLRETSAILTQLSEQNGLLIVGAEYSLESGEVDFFEGVPDNFR